MGTTRTSSDLSSDCTVKTTRAGHRESNGDTRNQALPSSWTSATHGTALPLAGTGSRVGSSWPGLPFPPIAASLHATSHVLSNSADPLLLCNEGGMPRAADARLGGMLRGRGSCRRGRISCFQLSLQQHSSSSGTRRAQARPRGAQRGATDPCCASPFPRSPHLERLLIHPPPAPPHLERLYCSPDARGDGPVYL